MSSFPPEFFTTHFHSCNPPVRWPERFAIVTAWNPGGVMHGQKENETFDAALASELKSRRLTFWRITGGSPDFSHNEPGYGILCELSIAIELGKQFIQVGVFWVEQGNIHLVSCINDDREYVAKWKDRLKVVQKC